MKLMVLDPAKISRGDDFDVSTYQHDPDVQDTAMNRMVEGLPTATYLW